LDVRFLTGREQGPPIESLGLSRFLRSHNAFRLWTLLALDNVELHIVTFFQAFVPIQLDGAVVNKYIRPIFSADETVSLGIVEPLHFSDILSHFAEPFSGERGWTRTNLRQLIHPAYRTRQPEKWFCGSGLFRKTIDAAAK
jgi:hypothetical protein